MYLRSQTYILYRPLDAYIHLKLTLIGTGIYIGTKMAVLHTDTQLVSDSDFPFVF